MQDIFVDAGILEVDEHLLLFIDDGCQESEGTWEVVSRRLRRLPSGQDFVITKADDLRLCSFAGPVLEHWYDQTLQKRYEGSDDVLEFLDEFVSSGRRMSYVRKLKLGH